MDNQQVSYLEVYKQHTTHQTIEVSESGIIRRVRDKTLITPRINAQGYKVFNVKYLDKSVALKIHRLVAELFLPPPDDELLQKCSQEHHKVVLVRHLDNDKLNNHYSNLEWCDLKTNTQQAWGDGLIPRLIGSLNGRAILTEELVHKICKDYEAGMSPKEAQAKYSISKQQSTKIRGGYQWNHIWCLYDIKVNRRVKTSTVSRET